MKSYLCLRACLLFLLSLTQVSDPSLYSSPHRTLPQVCSQSQRRADTAISVWEEPHLHVPRMLVRTRHVSHSFSRKTGESSHMCSFLPLWPGATSHLSQEQGSLGYEDMLYKLLLLLFCFSFPRFLTGSFSCLFLFHHFVVLFHEVLLIFLVAFKGLNMLI